jgi:hypothetical protein
MWVTSSGTAQEADSFQPEGKVIARSFLDYSAGFGKANDQSGFDITRAFLGYNYRFTPTVQARVVIDGASGRTASGSLEPHLRNAYINWTDYDFNVHLGQIGLLQFSLQEEYWMHRYVMKSFQDLNKMAPSVDLGVTAQYKFNSLLSADVSLTNGEGYKKLSKNNSNRYAGGLNIRPFSGFVVRAYADVYTDSEDIREEVPEGVKADYKNQYTLSLFAGYKNDFVSAGAEYNRVYNQGFIKGKDFYGYSFYSSVKPAPRWRLFTRYDIADFTQPTGFTDDSSGTLFVIGAEFIPWNRIKIAPNFRNINPGPESSSQYLFINLEFNL